VCQDPDAVKRFLDVQAAYKELLNEKGSLETVGKDEWRAKWQTQVMEMRQRAQEKVNNAAADERARAGLNNAEGRQRFQEMKRSVREHESCERRQRVGSQLQALQARAARKRDLPQAKKTATWVEPEDYDPEQDGWYHGVQ